MNRKENLPFKYTGYIYVTKEGQISMIDALDGDRLIRSNIVEIIAPGYYMAGIKIDTMSIAETNSAQYLFQRAKYRE